MPPLAESTVRLVGGDHADLTDTQNADEGPCWYDPTAEDGLHIIHALLVGQSFDRFDQADYERARDISLQARSIDPDDSDWIRAQIAAVRGDGEDPWEFYGQEMEKNPSLDQHAVDRRQWPDPFNRYFEDPPEGFVNHPAHDFFHTMGLASDRALDRQPNYNNDELIEQFSAYSTQRLISIVISLYGQEGFEAILWIPWVQESLQSTHAKEFGHGGIYPSLRVEPLRRLQL